MGLKIRSGQPIMIPPGRYPARLSDIRATTTRYGGALVVVFEIDSPDYEGESIDGMFPREITPRNKLGRLVANVGLSVDSGQALEASELIGAPIGVVVNNKQGRAYTFAAVVDTYPLR